MSDMVEMLNRVLWEYEENRRQTGRTTRLVEQAKKTNSIIVCHNCSWASYLQKDFGVKAISLDAYLDPYYHLGKMKKEKHIFDSPAEVELIMRKLKEAKRIIENGP